jgi:hypothetical protein
VELQFINSSMYSGPAPIASSVNIREIACRTAFGGRLVTNNFRGLIAEAIVSSILGPEWSWCSADYAGWDFVRSDGLKLEVKQSAARQTWVKSSGKPSVCSFDIRARHGRYEGADWFDEPGRNANLYVFAHHEVTDESADHCDPQQWLFYVIDTTTLPSWKRIGISNLRKLAKTVTIHELRDEITRVAQSLSSDPEAASCAF